MRKAVLTVVVLAASSVSARPPRPHLTAPAAALLAKGAAFLAPADNLLIPLDGGKPVAFLEPAPEHLFRLADHKLVRVASQVGAMPAATPDLTLVAGIEDKRTLRLTRGEEGKRVPYHREGRFELEHPYVTPDGAAVLVAVRDYTQPLDAFDFLLVDTKTLALEEIHLSKRFVPGPLRQLLSPERLALQMFTQRSDDEGNLQLEQTDFVVFDFQTHKLGPAPPDLRPGLPSASGKFSLLPGPITYSDDKRCGGDETRLYEAGKPQPVHFALPGTVVTLLDVLPDETAVIANLLTLKTCKSRGVLIPLGADVKPSSWKPFPLPQSPRLQGRILR